MNSQNLKAYAIVGAVFLVFCYASYLVGQWNTHNQGAALPSAPVAEHQVQATIKAKDKHVLLKRKEIPKAVAADSSKEVTATGTKKDDTGTTYISSILDVPTGQSVIVQERPAVEFLSTNAIGIGAGFRQDGFYKEVYYRRDLARVWDFYFSAEASLYWIDMGRHDYRAGVRAEYRF